MDNLTRREEINLHEAVQKSFPKILIKDLTEYERICPVCNGLGMRIADNIYGIKGDNSEAGRKYHFPIFTPPICPKERKISFDF